MAFTAAYVGVLNILVGLCAVGADLYLLIEAEKSFINFAGEDHMGTGVSPYNLRDRAGSTVFDFPGRIGINN